MNQLPNLALRTYNINELSQLLKNKTQPIQLFYFEKLDSTNDFLLSQINEIEFKRAVAICEVQKKGRGRFERKWQSIDYGQITLSYLYQSAFEIQYFQLLSIACTIECLIALEKLGFKGLKIKWPNDLYVANQPNPQKLAGILIDTNLHTNQANKASQTALIIGLGLNLMVPLNQNTLQSDHFASLEKLNAKVFYQLTKNQIGLALIDAIEIAIENLESGKNKKYIDLFNQYHLFAHQMICFKTANGDVIEGINQGINDFAQLIIESQSKQLLFSQGQILLN